MENLSKCLCYSLSRGLHVNNLNNIRDDESILFSAYENKGFHSASFSLPDEDLSVQIESNFKYCGASYLYATVTKNNLPLLDPDIDKIYVLNHCNLNYFSVPAEDWTGLFNKIITASKILNIDDVSLSLINYIDEMQHILRSDCVNVKSAMHMEKCTLWDKRNLLLLLVGNKFGDFLENITLAKNENDVLTNHALDFCNEYLDTLKQKLDYEDLSESHKNQLSRELFHIHKYMNENGNGLDFLEFFL